RPRVESEKRSGRDRDLLAIDPVHARSADDHIDLLLPRLGLVVLAPLAVRCDLEPVDPERLDAEHLPNEAHRPAGPRAFDLVKVRDRVAHLHPKTPNVVSGIGAFSPAEIPIA